MVYADTEKAENSRVVDFISDLFFALAGGSLICGHISTSERLLGGSCSVLPWVLVVIWREVSASLLISVAFVTLLWDFD